MGKHVFEALGENQEFKLLQMKVLIASGVYRGLVFKHLCDYIKDPRRLSDRRLIFKLVTD